MENKNRLNTARVALLSVVYLSGSSMLIGFKMDQLFLVALFNTLYHWSSSTRKFILGYLIFIIFWIIFDLMKAMPNYNFNNVHIEDLYLREKKWFGINHNGTILTPNEYANNNSNTFFDILSGLFYLNWMPIPLIFAFYLFKKNKLLFLRFSLSFLLVNLIGFLIYYIYPAAPPWYVKEYGFDLHLNTPGHTAGLSRFDDFFGVSIFKSLYSKSSNVFAAMPSLHCAYPVIVFYFGIKKKLGLLNILLFIFMIGIWFSAVYTGHHYVQDVIMGIFCALGGLFVFEKVLTNITWFENYLNRYKKVIS